MLAEELTRWSISIGLRYAERKNQKKHEEKLQPVRQPSVHEKSSSCSCHYALRNGIGTGNLVEGEPTTLPELRVYYWTHFIKSLLILIAARYPNRMEFKAVVSGSALSPNSVSEMMRPMIEDLNNKTAEELLKAIDSSMLAIPWMHPGGWLGWFYFVAQKVAQLIGALVKAQLDSTTEMYEQRLIEFFRYHFFGDQVIEICK